MKTNIKVIAFDADDTLWVNESYFQDMEAEYCQLLTEFLPAEKVSKELLKTEIQNITIYGFGIKSFTLSMIETAIRISSGKIKAKSISQIIDYGKRLLNMPVELLPDVEDVLLRLSANYNLVVATKGDLMDQERKLKSSGLENYFHHVEVMSDKKIEDYQTLLTHLNCKPEDFLMIGNSMKSDILPVLELGGYAAHIPFYITWAHEVIENNINNSRFIELNKLTDIFSYLNLER